MAIIKDELDDFESLISMPMKDAERYMLRRHTHPEFNVQLDEIARKVGLQHTPHMMIIPTPIPNAIANPNHGTLFFTQGFLDMVGQKSLREPLNKNMEMVIAHEMSHIKDGMKPFIMGKYLPVLIPAAAIAAFALHEDCTRNKKHAQPSGADIEHAAHARQERLREGYAALPQGTAEEHQARNAAHSWQEQLWNAGKYLAIGAAGYYAGLLGTRQIMLAAEYRADRAAIFVGRDPEGYIKSLETLGEEMLAQYRKRATETPAAANFAEQIKDFIAVQKRELDHFAKHAHPTDAERANHVRAYMQRLEAAETQGLPLPR